MAHYNSEINKIVYFKDEEIEGYPDWKMVDCGCSGGLEWGRDTPIECKTCGGSGTICKHKVTGVTKDYPGGKFV